MVTYFPILPRTHKYSMNHPAESNSVICKLCIFFHLKCLLLSLHDQKIGLDNHYIKKVNLHVIRLELNDKLGVSVVVDLIKNEVILSKILHLTQNNMLWEKYIRTGASLVCRFVTLVL